LAADALVLDGVHAHYGRSHVLHGVSLALARGELLALLGRNGAGKSTTMSAISGLLKPSAGRIVFGGRSIETLVPEAIARAGLRLVPQGRRVFASLTVQENLAVAAQQRGGAQPWNADRVFELFPQLRPRHRQRAGTLSGGEQQMLAIGRALMGNPEVLLLDEPSEGLAPLVVAEVARGIAQLRREGLSILLVEQNFALAMQLADHVVILNTGEVAMSAPADEVRAHPDKATVHLSVA
jgi:branched-chain amino acid transport system ATP-binding protein